MINNCSVLYKKMCMFKRGDRIDLYVTGEMQQSWDIWTSRIRL